MTTVIKIQIRDLLFAVVAKRLFPKYLIRLEIVGFVWYGIFTDSFLLAQFGTTNDMELHAIMKQTTPLHIALLCSVAASFLQAFVLVHVLQLMRVTSLPEALRAAFWLWLGFTLAPQWTHHMFDIRPMVLLLIHSLHDLVGAMAQAVILYFGTVKK